MAEKTSLGDMVIGDIIKAFYNKGTQNIYFAGEGTSLTSPLSTTYYQYVSDGSYVDDHANSIGYFYFVKVSRNMLIADRIIDRQISYNSMIALCNNVKKYTIGALSYNEYYKYLTSAGIYRWAVNTDVPLSRSDIAYYYSFRTVIEMLSDTSGSNVRCNLNLNMAMLNGGILYREATSNNQNQFSQCPIYIDMNTSKYTNYSGGGGTTLFAYTGFRPKITFTDKKLYQIDNNIYSVNNGDLQQLSDKWNELSNTEKVSIFQTASKDELPINKLITMNKFKILIYSILNEPASETITAIPQSDQFVYMKNDIEFKGMSYIDWIHVNDGVIAEAGNGVIRHLASRDNGKTYYAYNTVTSNWDLIIDTADTTDGSLDSNSRFVLTVAGLIKAKTNGMTTTVFNAAPWGAWTLDQGYKAVRFGYLISITASTDTTFYDALKYQYDGTGTWDLGANKVDYKVSTGNNSHAITWLSPAGGKRAKINY